MLVLHNLQMFEFNLDIRNGNSSEMQRNRILIEGIEQRTHRRRVKERRKGKEKEGIRRLVAYKMRLQDEQTTTWSSRQLRF